MEMIERRISDGSVLQLIRKWIQVGVIDEGRLLVSETGYRARADDQSAPRQHLPALRCARINLVLPAGEIPAPTRGAAASPGIESWVGGGNESGQA